MPGIPGIAPPGIAIPAYPYLCIEASHHPAWPFQHIHTCIQASHHPAWPFEAYLCPASQASHRRASHHQHSHSGISIPAFQASHHRHGHSSISIPAFQASHHPAWPFQHIYARHPRHRTAGHLTTSIAIGISITGIQASHHRASHHPA